jgi:uncharacterized membrane protein YtjA (UPF0391 family)
MSLSTGALGFKIRQTVYWKDASPIVTSTELQSRRAKLGQGGNMLRWAVAFFIIALIAAIFGFGGIAVAAAGIAKILFFIFLVLFLVALLSGLVRRA